MMKLLFTCLGFLTVMSFVTAQTDGLDYDSAKFSTYLNESRVYHASPDTLEVEVKYFSNDKIAALKSNPDFNYKEPPTVAESLWERLMQWIGQFFSALFEGATSTNWGRVLIYATALAGLIIIILMILRVNAFRLFYSGADRGSITTSLFHENIHEMDFDRLIQESLAKKKYREGIRLLFLHSLKILTDKQFIHWQAGKTNHDYVAELSSGELKTNLNELSFYFDYAWYGNFPIREEIFVKTQELFHSLKQKTSG